MRSVRFTRYLAPYSETISSRLSSRPDASFPVYWLPALCRLLCLRKILFPSKPVAILTHSTMSRSLLCDSYSGISFGARYSCMTAASR